MVSLAQLAELGLAARGVSHRVATGRLHRVRRGVFAVGRPGLTRAGRWSADVLACGTLAALSNRSAAEHRDLLPATNGATHVTVPGAAGRRLRGVRAHSAATLLPTDVSIHRGIPTTAVARTILDLAETGPRRTVERAIDRADEVHHYDFEELNALVYRSPRRRGAQVVAAILDADVPPARTRSELEEAFLALCEAERLPRPRVNMWIPFPEGGGVEADFCWPDQRGIVETDSLTFHRTQAAMSHDYLRDQRLELTGWRVRRVGWDQVFHTSAHVARIVRGLLG